MGDLLDQNKRERKKPLPKNICTKAELYWIGSGSTLMEYYGLFHNKMVNRAKKVQIWQQWNETEIKQNIDIGE
jgi:hypothetical protein